MFANKKRHILASAIQVTGMTVLLAGLTACGGSSSDDSAAIEGQVPSEPGTVVRGKTEKDQSVFTSQVPRLLMVQFVDAKTGQPVNDVTATIYAPVAVGEGNLNEVRFGSEEGSPEAQRTLRAENGQLNLAFTDMFVEGGGDAKQLRIQAAAAGYFSGGTTVHVEPQAQGDYDAVTVSLVSKEDAPEGVAVATDGTTADNGVPAKALELPVGDGKFSLSANTVLKDAAGNLLTGDVSVEVALFDPSSDEALAAFPGGFTVGPDTERLNGAEPEGNFLSAGFMAVDIVDGQGRKAHDLGGDATLRFPIDASAINPETGVALKAGDTVSVWSHDEATGRWAEEDQGGTGESVIQEDNDGLYVEVSTSHLSYWNLDWHYSAKCHRPVKFTDEDGNALAKMPLTGIDLSVKITPQGDDSGYYYGSSRTLNMLDVENTIANTPNSSEFMLELQPMIRGDVVGEPVTVPVDPETVPQGPYQGCDDVFVAVNPEKFPETSTITASAYITAPQTLTYWEVDRLILEANDVNSAEELQWEDGGDKWEDRLEILNETHPGSNPEDTSYYGGSSEVYNIRANRFRFSDIYQKLLDRELLTRTEIATVQQVLKTRFLLEDATFYYTFRADDGGYLYQRLTMQQGEVDVPVLGKGWAYGTVYANVAPEGENAKWVSASASTYVNPEEDTELEIAFTDAAAIAELFSAMLENNKVSDNDDEELQEQ